PTLPPDLGARAGARAPRGHTELGVDRGCGEEEEEEEEEEGGRGGEGGGARNNRWRLAWPATNLKTTRLGRAAQRLLTTRSGTALPWSCGRLAAQGAHAAADDPLLRGLRSRSAGPPTRNTLGYTQE
ncbi:unnamed protein product, partial [Prorocentrum cordatum]